MQDLAIYDAANGGDLIQLENGALQGSSGFSNQIYLALFGGNVEQNTQRGVAEQEQRGDYWGNQYLQPAQYYNSVFEMTLKSVALNTAGVIALENAAKTDLAFLQDFGDLSVEGSIASGDRFGLSVTLEQPNAKTEKLRFMWDGLKAETITNESIGA